MSIGATSKPVNDDMSKKTRTVGEQIEAVMPKSIDDIIRKNRDKASLRFSTPQDLAPIAGEIPPSARAVPISRWNLVTLALSPDGERPVQVHVLVLGWNVNESCTWNTSPVQRYDTKAGLVTTRSGTLYRLAGPQGTDEDLDLIHLCIYLRGSGAGDLYGIPAFFY